MLGKTVFEGVLSIHYLLESIILKKYLGVFEELRGCFLLGPFVVELFQGFVHIICDLQPNWLERCLFNRALSFKDHRAYHLRSACGGYGVGLPLSRLYARQRGLGAGSLLTRKVVLE